MAAIGAQCCHPRDRGVQSAIFYLDTASQNDATLALRSTVSSRPSVGFAAEHLFRASLLIVLLARHVINPVTAAAPVAFDHTARALGLGWFRYRLPRAMDVWQYELRTPQPCPCRLRPSLVPDVSGGVTPVGSWATPIIRAPCGTPTWPTTRCWPPSRRVRPG